MCTTESEKESTEKSEKKDTGKEIVYWEDLKFTGTENYYRHALGCYLTDGVKHMAEELECYWFLDIIVSYLREVKRAGEGCALLHVNKKNCSAVFLLTDLNGEKILSQPIEFTHCKENLRVWILPGDNMNEWIILLPSEY